MTKALILKVTIEHRRPLTWRRLAVAPETTYTQLHQIIQAAFGWENRHLYAFYPAWDRSLVYEDVQADDEAFGLDARSYQVLPDLKQGTILYEYDFGASWEHRIKLEATKELPLQLPQCLDLRGGGFYEDSDDPIKDEVTVESINQDLADLKLSQPAAQAPISPENQAIQQQLESVVTTQLKQAWTLYRRSPQRAEIAAYPDSFIMAILGMFASVAMRGKPAASWSMKQIEAGLVEALTYFKADEDTQAATLMIVGDFLYVSASNKLLPVTPAALEPLYGRLAQQFDLIDDDDDDFSDDPAGDTALAEYGEAINAFLTSLQWTKLRVSDQQLAADLLLGFIANLYEQTGRLIAEWQPADIDAAFLDLYPRQILLQEAEWPMVPKLLDAFIAYLQVQHALPAKVAKRLRATIKADTPQMLAMNADHDNWAANKQLAQQMQDDGVDLNDDAAIQAYVAAHPSLGIGSDSPYVPAITAKAHVAQVADKTWRQATATRVHNNAADVMHKLPLGELHPAVDMVCDFVDAMYATTLQTPLQWQPAALAKAWQAHLDLLQPDARRQHTEWLAAYCTALGAYTSLSQNQAGKLVAAVHQAFNATPRQAAAESRATKSNVVPFRQR